MDELMSMERLETKRKTNESNDYSRTKSFDHTVCWPKQEIVVGTWHTGQDRDFLIYFPFSFIPHGVFDAFISSFIKTESWHIAKHKCEQSFNDKLHCCLQSGHSLKWHKCGSRSVWWQSDGFLLKINCHLIIQKKHEV